MYPHVYCLLEPPAGPKEREAFQAQLRLLDWPYETTGLTYCEMPQFDKSTLKPSWYSAHPVRWAEIRGHMYAWQLALSSQEDTSAFLPSSLNAVDGGAEALTRFWQILPGQWEMVCFSGRTTNTTKALSLPANVPERSLKVLRGVNETAYAIRREALRDLHDYVLEKLLMPAVQNPMNLQLRKLLADYQEDCQQMVFCPLLWIAR